MLLTVTRSYREAMREFASQGNLEVWYERFDVEAALAEVEDEDPKAMKRVRKGVAKARSKDSLRALEKLTEVVDGELRFRSEPPLLVPAEELSPVGETGDLRQAMLQVLAVYRETLPGDRQHLLEAYELQRIARKVVGVGSVGTRAWVILLDRRRRRRPAVPAGQGGRGLGAGALRRAPAASATTGAGWSKASA